MFCRTNVKNKYHLGKLITKEDISAHYYCVLFAPGLKQNGDLNQGIDGFLVDDIKKEVRRGSRLSCSYCRKSGAVIGCAIIDCNIKFHLTCGLINNSFHDFHNEDKTFPSFCSQHRPNQRIHNFGHKSDNLCAICRESVDQKPKPQTLWSPCCYHWYHRECVVKQSYHAAKHHFKCSNCNNRDEFVKEMKKFGVYVPSRDASWEKNNRFEDLYQRNYSCGAKKCNCRKGRQHNGDNEWEILACDGCGANSTHIKCAKLDVGSDEWFCDVCQPILSNKKQKVLQEN